MSIRLFNNSGGYIDLESGGTSAAANVFTLPAETGTILTSATLSGINASALSAGTLAAARLPAGSVLQVIQGSTNTETIIASTTFADTSLSASITPTSSNSKILIFINQLYNISRTANAQFGGIRLLRGSTVITNPAVDAGGPYDFGGAFGSTTSFNFYGRITVIYLDSPSTTSSTTYKTQGAIYYTSNFGTSKYQPSGSSYNGTSYITLMEIAA